MTTRFSDEMNQRFYEQYYSTSIKYFLSLCSIFGTSERIDFQIV